MSDLDEFKQLMREYAQEVHAAFDGSVDSLTHVSPGQRPPLKQAVVSATEYLAQYEAIDAERAEAVREVSAAFTPRLLALTKAYAGDNASLAWAHQRARLIVGWDKS